MCTYLNKTGAMYYFRRPVPEDLTGFFKTGTGGLRTEWKYSLRTKDRETAKRRLRPHEVDTDQMIDEARKALANSPVAEGPETSVEERSYAARIAEQAEAMEAAEAAKQARYEARRAHRVAVRERMMLGSEELSPEEAAWRDIVRERGQPLELLQEAAAWQEAATARYRAKVEPPLRLLELFDRYEASGAANPKTARKWRSRVENLIAHLGHDDASRVERADMNGWTAALIAKGLTIKTVRDGYLPAIRAAFSIAYEDGDIPTNPAAGLKVRGPKAVKLRERDHSDDEAATILRAALGPQPAGLADHHARARRWVPWLCAYTGARVGEITQLRAMDIQREGDIWLVDISPEADGGVKTGEARKVPLHSHLVEQGFIAFAKAGDPTPLFFQEGTGNAVNPASKIRASALARWVRTLGVETPQPNHGWRHRFKTLCRIAEIPEDIMDKIQGHAALVQGRKYGVAPLITLYNAIEKLPRYKL